MKNGEIDIIGVDIDHYFDYEAKFNDVMIPLYSAKSCIRFVLSKSNTDQFKVTEIESIDKNG